MKKWLDGTTNLVTVASLGFVMSFGCGGAQEELNYAPRERELPRPMEAIASVEVPEATAQGLKACVGNANIPRNQESHAFQYDLGASEQGEVSTVDLRDATMRDTSLEGCFRRVLEALVVPDEVLRMRGGKPFSGGENQYRSRGNVGIVQAAAAPIALAPIIIPALGITIIVAISIDIIRKATSEPDCKEVKQDCIHACESKLPTGDYGFKFWNCVNLCMQTAGC